MKQLAYLLLATALLAAPACSKDDPEPAAETNTARYILDGRTVAAAPAPYPPPGGAGGVGAEDYLSIRVANPASSSEVIYVMYAKAAGAPETAYRPLRLEVVSNTSATGYYSDNLTLTVSKTGKGYSGTFAGRLPNSAGVVPSQLSSGVFTNVQ